MRCRADLCDDTPLEQAPCLPFTWLSAHHMKRCAILVSCCNMSPNSACKFLRRMQILTKLTEGMQHAHLIPWCWASASLIDGLKTCVAIHEAISRSTYAELHCRILLKTSIFPTHERSAAHHLELATSWLQPSCADAGRGPAADGAGALNRLCWCPVGAVAACQLAAELCRRLHSPHHI